VGKPATIAIDGPAASGKTTVAEKLAKCLGYIFFDTGVMYRAVTLTALKKFHGVDDEDQVAILAETIQIDVTLPTQNDGRLYTVLVDGKDITWEIRTPEVDANVSQVSAYRRVRTALTLQQRKIGERGMVIMVGRDIGTVVMPDAPLKIYLDASVEERARRRYMEVVSRGQKAKYEEILEAMKKRDQIDSSRAIAPLMPASDAIIIQTDGMGIGEVVDHVKGLVKENHV
jgi:cytidylate kinase